jgi:hypothetical protein
MKAELTSFALALVFWLASDFSTKAQRTTAPAEARATTKEAFIYGHAPMMGYQTFYNQTQNSDFGGYIDGLGRYRLYSRVATAIPTAVRVTK